MVVTNDPALYEKLFILRVHGSKPKYHHEIVGGNFRIDALQAAVLSVKLKYLDGWSAGRRRNAEFYDKAFKDSGLAKKGILSAPPPVYKAGGDSHYHIYNQYTLRVNDRDKLQAHLKAGGIGNEVYYPVPLHLQVCFSGLGYRAGDIPRSEEAAAEVISIPVYPELTIQQMKSISDAIVQFYL
jgi:dTDP-4-amino-4,6-dideoxygalactose transaminase